MSREYDLINELGSKNWLDVAAGEAVILGHSLNDPCLVAKGTELATQIRKIPFDNDRFSKVGAKARDLETELTERKRKEQTTMFIDDFYLGKEKEKSLYDWEFSFISVEGRYLIQMILPMYYDKAKFADAIKTEAEIKIRAVYADPSFQNYKQEVKSTECQGQTFVNTRYFDDKGRLVRRTVDFKHHEKMAWGWIDYYYFDDFAKVCEAWQGVREAFTSDQKK